MRNDQGRAFPADIRFLDDRLIAAARALLDGTDYMGEYLGIDVAGGRLVLTTKTMTGSGAHCLMNLLLSLTLPDWPMRLTSMANLDLRSRAAAQACIKAWMEG